MRVDVVIAGAGLAGACAALWLARAGRRVVVLDSARPGAASAAAAGLVNPFMGPNARPTWRHGEALDALHATLEAAGAPGLFRAIGVLRPARDPRQARAFASTSAAHPAEATWLGFEAARERAPDVAAPLGALWIPSGGAAAIPALVRALLDAARAYGAEVRMDTLVAWETSSSGLTARTEHQEAIETGRLLLALGDGFDRFPALAALGLTRVKGQTVRLARPPGPAAGGPALSGDGYVVPDGDGLVVGATFEHDFADLAPDPVATTLLVAKAVRLVPALAGADVLDARAGVRVGVAGTRLPLVGPLPGQPRVWAFTGFGGRGLLTAPLLAQALPRWLDRPSALPPEVRLPTAPTRPDPPPSVLY